MEVHIIIVHYIHIYKNIQTCLHTLDPPAAPWESGVCMNVYLKMHRFERVPWEILYMMFNYVNHISLSQIITGLKL